MADVEMPDASEPSGTGKGKTLAKSVKATGADISTEGKKPKFEVKKVSFITMVDFRDLITIVERRCALGLGYRRGQLRHLSQPHYGSL